MLPYSKEYESIVSKNTTYSIFDRIIKSPKDIDKLNKYYKNISIIDLRHYKEFNEYHIH
jgi:hypothetical protein